MARFARDLVAAVDPTAYYGLQLPAGAVVKLESYRADGAFYASLGSVTVPDWATDDGPWTPIRRPGHLVFAWRTVAYPFDDSVDPVVTRLSVMDFDAATVTQHVDSRPAPWDGLNYSRYVAPFASAQEGRIMWIESDGVAEGANAVRLHTDSWALDDEEIRQTIEPSSMNQVRGVAWAADRVYVVLSNGIRLELPYSTLLPPVERSVDYTGTDLRGIAQQQAATSAVAVRGVSPASPTGGDIYAAAGGLATFSTLLTAAGGFQARSPAVSVRPVYIDVKAALGDDEPAEVLVYDFTDLHRYLADATGSELIETITVSDAGPEGTEPDLMFYAP